ncbi:MAG: hypothetical protein AAB914_01465, partial [Patescibacteria group bacterium]
VPVIDGLASLNDIGINYGLATPNPQLGYQYISSVSPPTSMTSGTSISPQKASITVRNTSNSVWRSDASGGRNPVRLVMTSPNYRSSPFYDSADPAWLAPSQIAMKTPVVNPGENAVFEFGWKAPAQTGNYLEYFTLVVDGYKIFPEYGSAFRTIVN